MSSTEQAPEPTMDEILASIRKIISDDDTGSESAGDEQPQVAEAESDEAIPAESSGDGLVDDLANALNDVQDIEAKTAEQPAEDILDLTQEVAGQPSDEAPSEAAAAPEAAAPIDAVMLETSEIPEVAATPEAAATSELVAAPEAALAEEAEAESEAPATADAPTDDSDIATLLAEAGIQDIAEEADAGAAQESAMPSGDELNVAIEQEETAVADTPDVEEASISGAGSDLEPPPAEAAPADAASEESVQSQDASFDTGLVIAPAAEPQAPAETGEALAEEASEQLSEAEAVAESAANVLSQLQPAETGGEEAQSENQIENSLSEPEAPAIDEPVEAVAALAGVLEGQESGESEPAPLEEAASGEAEAILEAEAALRADLPPEAEEAAPAEESDDAAASGEVRTLEDSVKEMLRPMLREWLDDNMERIVHDEVENAKTAGGDG